ncbi:hypothetical protein DPMN_027364 [Dreissena polymorpha]|uniref:Uncharacterized protein n=1 Tax=Dreissena polymorpha TaxID=45954 RepID=A0A9D4RF60_DREPO|nr:hypothetical protein DPMN_027364 [Dreissena polymorpha]
MQDRQIRLKRKATENGLGSPKRKEKRGSELRLNRTSGTFSHPYMNEEYWSPFNVKDLLTSNENTGQHQMRKEFLTSNEEHWSISNSEDVLTSNENTGQHQMRKEFLTSNEEYWSTSNAENLSTSNENTGQHQTRKEFLTSNDEYWSTSNADRLVNIK